MTEDNIKFIKKNRFTMSIVDMGKEINLPYHTVRTYMKRNNLQVSKDVIRSIRKNRKPKEMPFENTIYYWNRNLVF